MQALGKRIKLHIAKYVWKIEHLSFLLFFFVSFALIRKTKLLWVNSLVFYNELRASMQLKFHSSISIIDCARKYGPFEF